ncbi:hypothetical protein, partial [Sphingobacterium siyangense]|uniref:hypothetical protein n=1 Tax=Sphingobacterium siyangense TaxID=459529 RepID=UPI002FD9C565
YTEALAGNSQGLLSFRYFRISMYRLLPILCLSVIPAQDRRWARSIGSCSTTVAILQLLLCSVA